MNEDESYGIGDGFWSTGLYGDGFPDPGVVTLDPFDVTTTPDTTGDTSGDDGFGGNPFDWDSFYSWPDNYDAGFPSMPEDYGFGGAYPVAPAVPATPRPTTPTNRTPTTPTTPRAPSAGPSGGSSGSSSASNSAISALNKAVTDLGKLATNLLGALRPQAPASVSPSGAPVTPGTSVDMTGILLLGGVVFAAVVLLRRK